LIEILSSGGLDIQRFQIFVVETPEKLSGIATWDTMTNFPVRSTGGLKRPKN